MYCTNCGKEILADSKFCTNCGKSIENKNIKMGKITFHRIKRWLGCLIDIKVYIDNVFIGTLSNDGTIATNVSFGTHKVVFELWSGINEEQITITEEYPNVYADMKLKMGAFTNKPTIVNIRNER